MEKLIGMTDFVLEQKYTTTIDMPQLDWFELEVLKLEKIRRYANFLKQPLTLGMFVPTDEDGNLLEEPSIDNSKYYTIQNNGSLDRVMFNNDLETYREAKERVLFHIEIPIDVEAIKYHVEINCDVEYLANKDFPKIKLTETLMRDGKIY